MRAAARRRWCNSRSSWHEPAANRARFEALLLPLAGHTDLVVLPETFTTGFSMAGGAARGAAGGATTQWLTRLARSVDAAVTGSVITLEGGRYYNRLLWAAPDGQLRHYDKRHLFRMGREHQHFTAGRSGVEHALARLAASARWCATT